MIVPLAISLVTLAFHAAATVALLAIARAPGGQRVRPVVLLAASAGLYSLTNVFGATYTPLQTGIAVATTVNLSLAALHATFWLWYTFSDENGGWASIPRGVRRIAIANVGVAVVLSLTGNVVSSGAFDRVVVPLFNLDYAQPRMTVMATVSAMFILATLLTSFMEFVRRARRRVPGAFAISLGFAFFMACSIAEGLVAIGELQFIYLAEIGYLVLITPVSAKLIRRFIADARRLTLLTERLSDEVECAVRERDSARDALANQARMAALGRIAAGVGHEVNNPLQYLVFSLEELREESEPWRSATTDTAFANAFEATDRIRRVVEGLRAYASNTRDHFRPLDVRDVVRSALRVAAPQMHGEPDVRPTYGPVPRVLGDEGKLVQAVTNAVLNSAHVLRTRGGGSERATIHIATRTTPNGDAEIEVTDNGPGFPPELLPRLGEPFVTTRVADGGSGLGVFVIRGVVDAHGGTLELRNASAASGGAELRIRLPAAPPDYGTTGVASISTSAPASIKADPSTAVMAG